MVGSGVSTGGTKRGQNRGGRDFGALSCKACATMSEHQSHVCMTAWESPSVRLGVSGRNLERSPETPWKCPLNNSGIPDFDTSPGQEI